MIYNANIVYRIVYIEALLFWAIKLKAKEYVNIASGFFRVIWDKMSYFIATTLFELAISDVCARHYFFSMSHIILNDETIFKYGSICRVLLHIYIYEIIYKIVYSGTKWDCRNVVIKTRCVAV